ncbi:MAG: hypothetical protein K2N47_03155 [Clostridia bacterium]|nr:hypothetical protein [Clostridia bacterium]
MAKKKYSASERKAFHMGRAYAAGKAGKRIPCPDEKTKKSFRNGVKATRERIKGGGKSDGTILIPVNDKQCLKINATTGEVLGAVNCITGGAK